MSIADWKDLMPDTVGVYELVSRDEYGDPTYGTRASYDARIVRKPTRVIDSAGDEVMAKGMVWIATTATIDPEDAIELPDGTRPPILSVSRFPDESGDHHIKVFFG